MKNAWRALVRLFTAPRTRKAHPKLVLPVTHVGDLHGYMFTCPGCKETHYLPTKVADAEGRRWAFNDDVGNPTFTPSHIHTIPLYDSEIICHVMIKEGSLDFFLDCTHELAGKTVPMLPMVE